MKPYFVRVVLAKIGFALAKKASRNQTWFDRIARRTLERVLKFNFDLDEMVLMDQGYDPDELDRYQNRR
ncbi:hypothetical protein JN531_006550 [Flagellatimonas centrodinii]|uniref:hypothetical protein n=1 Tax=Flagellatimonas centrodinii TaxID=2806210 RepID=UPI001FF016E5|nr:hypothetical protein [Flagellatimonas centrodinii]ULQ47945.1 hypothetical protein JN531_006550 [Flagellatimonas centrodinii]